MEVNNHTRCEQCATKEADVCLSCESNQHSAWRFDTVDSIMDMRHKLDRKEKIYEN
jgi:hypothetical protein